MAAWFCLRTCKKNRWQTAGHLASSEGVNNDENQNLYSNDEVIQKPWPLIQLPSLSKYGVLSAPRLKVQFGPNPKNALKFWKKALEMGSKSATIKKKIEQKKYITE